jgi:hypothetical protein
MPKLKSVPTFDEMLADITKFQFEIGKIAAKITNPRHKEVLGQALASVEKAKADFIIEYPKAMSTIQGSLAQSKASAEASLAKIAALQENFAAMQAATAAVAGAATAGVASAAKPAAPKFDGQLGKRLSSELVARVVETKPAAEPALLDDREIWQDWSRS